MLASYAFHKLQIIIILLVFHLSVAFKIQNNHHHHYKRHLTTLKYSLIIHKGRDTQ
jgi:hypothetical protein